MTSGNEPVLHALSVEPRVARPGEVVRLTFRTRNVGTVPSPAATVAFVLPAGLAALDALDAPLRSVAPGEEVTAAIDARVLPPFDERTELALQARVELTDARLTTNVCTLHVRSRAVLDGESSGTFVEPVDADTVRVSAVVCNEGDGPAVGVSVRLPSPAGCRRVDGEGAATLDVDRIEAGASVTLGFDARVEHAMTQVRCDGAEVRFGAGARRPICARNALALRPEIAAPVVVARPRRRGVELTVDVRNDGWAPAHDARLSMTLPAGLRLDEDSVAVDGIPIAAVRGRRASPAAMARLQRQTGMLDLVISLLPARSTTRLELTARHAADFAGGTVGVEIETQHVDLEYRAQQRQDVRVDALDVPHGVAPGETAMVRARIVNAGDRPERVGVALMRAGLMEALPVERTLEPGTFAVVDLALAIAVTAVDGLQVPFAVIVSDADGERARTDVAVTIRAPIVPTAEANDDARAFADRVPPMVHAALHAPDEVVTGASFAVRLDVDVEDALERLTIRACELNGTAYVGGSTSVGGCAVLDAAGGSLLYGDGLVVRGIPPGTRVTIGWSLLAGSAAAEALGIGVELDADGLRYAPEPPAVRIRGAEAFATRPAQLPYHVEAYALAAADDTAAPHEFDNGPHDDGETAFDLAIRPTTPLRAPRWEEIARLLHGARCDGLVLHVLALRAFFPEPQQAVAGAESGALDAVGLALRDVFDRLFVKLRIPGFTVGAEDLEDRRLRDALLALVDPDRSNRCYAALAAAPLGAPAALRALLATIVAADGDALLGTSVDDYLRALDVTLTAYEAVPVELFDDALARGRDRTLDDARAALLTLIDEQVTCRPIAC